MHDAELDELRNRVDCRAVLEKAGWQLDAPESSRNAAKYRDGLARIVIVTHNGRGWFDPLNDCRGDVITLAQHLWGVNIGHARKALRPLTGIAPLMQLEERARMTKLVKAPALWTDAKAPGHGSPGWLYLTEARGLPKATIEVAIRAGVLREGIYGTIWALHRRLDQQPCGWEMRGPAYKGFARGGRKTLFRLGEIDTASRIAVTESFIDALSLATIEDWPPTTAYISTGGGFGPETATSLSSLVPQSARLVAATDNGAGGELLAGRLYKLATKTGIGFSRLYPVAKDWNDQLREQPGRV